MKTEDFLKLKNAKKDVRALPTRLWKIGLKEAFDLHFRTYSAQIEEVKTKVSDYITKTESFKDIKSSFFHILNYICYNYNTFSAFEKAVFPYKFNSNKKKYLKSKKHFLLFIEYLNGLLTKEKATSNVNLKKSISVLLETENVKSFKSFKSFSNLLLTKKFFYYLIKIIKKKYHQTRQIVSQINPTMILDSECYKLSINKKTGECFIDIISLNKGIRIKNIPLSGYKHSLPKNHTSNICISFDSTEAQFFIHFSFNHKIKNKNKKLNEDSKIILGGDFGETEMLTLSDEEVIGQNQGKILKSIAEQTEKALAKVQKLSLNDFFFGIERKNTGRRNKRNNAFNHNKNKKNINYEYRKSQEKINRRLNQHICKCVNELKHHCDKNNVSELVVEDLSYSQLGRNKSQKQVFNLTKGFYEKIKELNFIKLSYVNPAKLFYLSIMSVKLCCGFVDKQNRSGDNFLCLNCHFSPDVGCSKADKAFM